MGRYTIFNPLGASIEASEITALAVTAAKLAADAVETAKIKDLNVTTAKIANDAIDKDKLGIVTTQGDLLVYTTEPARLAKGTGSQQLRMNAGATALEWFTASAGGGGTEIMTSGEFSVANAGDHELKAFTFTASDFAIGDGLFLVYSMDTSAGSGNPYIRMADGTNTIDTATLNNQTSAGFGYFILTQQDNIANTSVEGAGVGHDAGALKIIQMSGTGIANWFTSAFTISLRNSGTSGSGTARGTWWILKIKNS